VRKNPLPQKYKEALDSKDLFRLTIVGKDPYPQKAVGIPFCKPSWESMCDKRISGLFVLQSLGLDIKKARAEFYSPVEFFIYLVREKGIAFLNRSYHYLGGAVLKKHDPQLEDAEKINQKYLQKSQNTVLCGRWQEKHRHQKDFDNLNYAIHPDIRNRNLNRASWSEWWSEGALKKKFRL
jgi:hypothetical protein